MAERNLDIVIKAHDEYSRALNAANNSFSSFSSSVQKSAERMVNLKTVAVAATAAAAALGYEIYKAVGAATEAEAAEKKLSTALGFTSDALLQHAKVLQSVTQFGDDEVIGVQSTIAAYTKNEETIKSLTAATIDLATAKGIDLASAADMVAKSFGTSTNALGRQGVAVEGAIGSAQRLKNITEGIAALWGGQAAAAGETFAGKLAQMKNSFNDLQEEIGFTIVRNATFIKAADLLRNAINHVSNIIRENQNVIATWIQGGIVRFVEGIGTAIQVIGFFHRGWLGLRLVGQVVSLAIVDSVNITIRALRLLLTPLDLIYESMVRLGAIETNPFDKLINGIHEYRDAVVASGADVLVEIDDSQARFARYAAVVSNFATQLRETVSMTTTPITPPLTESPTENIVLAALSTASADEYSEGLIAFGNFNSRMQELRGFAQASELEQLTNFKAEKLAIIESGNTAELMADIQLGELRLTNERQINQMRLTAANYVANGLVAIMRNLTAASGREGGTMFAIMKSFSVAEAIIAGIGATLYAYREGNKLGGPPLGTAYAAIAAAVSASNVAAIVATKPGGGAAGVALSTGGGGSLGGAATAESFAGTTVPQTAQPTQNVTVVINNPLSEQNWQKIAEDNIVPAINAASERNIKLTLVAT
jgi:hypothetical protein